MLYFKINMLICINMYLSGNIVIKLVNITTISVLLN